jgi:outer membrane receptor protein involved in Fe transport
MKSVQAIARVSMLLIGCSLARVATAQQSSVLEEVIVTAQRRSETIKDVPFSVSAIGQDQLEQRHITNIEDVTRAIPGVSFGTGAVQGQDNITIRGIGSQTGNSAIGLYLDDVPIVTQNPWQPKNLLSDYKVIQHVLINSLESAYTLRPLTIGIKAVVKLGAPRP